ncbi:hypothetical protein ABT364_21770 [Massilia sp. SR12]
MLCLTSVLVLAGDAALPDGVISPASQYEIAASDARVLEAMAGKGNCQAAGHLARFHRNITLNYGAAVRWTRTAAKCPDLFHKEMLLGMYLYEGQQPGDAGEIERLLAEVERATPERAARFRAGLAGVTGK